MNLIVLDLSLLTNLTGLSSGLNYETTFDYLVDVLS